jgi:hypothetical protein
MAREAHYIRLDTFSTWPLIGVMNNIVVCGEIALLASEKKEILLHGQRGRGKVLYYADNALLTKRSSSQKYA